MQKQAPSHIEAVKPKRPKDPFYSSPEWYAIRRKVLARDNYRCVNCGESVRGKGQSRVDHIEPKKSRPDLALSICNLRTLCPKCDNQRHREKGYTRKDIRPVGLDGAPEGWLSDP